MHAGEDMAESLPSSTTPWTSSSGPTTSWVPNAYENKLNEITIWLSCFSLVACCYILIVFWIFRGHRVQTRRIAMLVLVTDLLVSIANIIVGVGSRSGGFLLPWNLTPAACFATGWQFAPIYAAGLAQLVMVFTLNYTVVLEHGQVKKRVEHSAYAAVALTFLVTLIVETFQCDGACRGVALVCYDKLSRWNVGYVAVAAIVVVAYCIAILRVAQRWKRLMVVLGTAARGGSIDEHGGFVPAMQTRTERVRAERMAKIKKRAVRDALFLFAPYTLGFVVTAAATFRLAVLDQRLATAPNSDSSNYETYIMTILQSLQPLLNAFASLMQPELRTQLDPRNAWKRFRRRMGWNGRRKRARRGVRIGSFKMRSMKLDNGGVGVPSALRFAEGATDGDDDRTACSGSGSGSEDYSDSCSNASGSTDDGTGYAAAEGHNDGIQLLELPNEELRTPK